MTALRFQAANEVLSGLLEVALDDGLGPSAHLGVVAEELAARHLVAVAFHLLADGLAVAVDGAVVRLHIDDSAVVVDGRVTLGGFPNHTVGIDTAADRSAEFARLHEQRAFAVHLAWRPRLVEESLPLEVAVELVGELDAEVVEDFALEVHFFSSFAGLFNLNLSAYET